MAEDHNSLRSNDNPFSFKHFLQQQKNASPSTVNVLESADSVGNNVFETLTNDQTNPFSFHNFSASVELSKTLPEKAKVRIHNRNEGHIPAVANRESSSMPENGDETTLELPDFVQDCRVPASSSSQMDESATPNRCKTVTSSARDNIPICGDADRGETSNDILGSHASENQDLHHFSNSECLACRSTHKLKAEIAELKEENSRLRNCIETMQVDADTKAKSLRELKEEFKQQKRKEVAETAALEKMVQQVEYNLKTATERAALAEAKVVKLKQEVKTMQVQVKSLQHENELLLHSHHSDSTVDSKARDIARKLSSAANGAEQSLQILLDGVEQLRLLSSLIADITKIEETP